MAELVTSDVDTAPDARVEERPTRAIPGEPGLWVFLLGDMVVFGVFFVSFLVERVKDPEAFEASREALGLTIGLTNTMVLLTSSLLVVLGLNAVRAGRHTIGSRMFAAAMGCGLLFAGLKTVEYMHMIGSGHGPDVNAYYMWFFILTGTHLFHVVIGVGVLGVLFTRARRPVDLTGSKRAVFEGGTCYWHLVDLLWMVLFPLVYLVG
ncbi:cytochrome c oxidase subunit 3 family protein [Rhodococcus opacus]|nr:cytochrome c oxidase subunit 3 family protein [Rhodococcus opacus]RZL74900.1 MAG: cytochrome c oxidase subunit 3 family protein [Rhodococcus sp. (in: high G+C Gram-positive bacteria)]